MNERIKELGLQAYTTALKESKDESGPNLCAPGSNYFIGLAQEKFAELIVKECTNTLRTEMYRLDAIPGREVSAQTMETAQDLINNHFGVEL